MYLAALAGGAHTAYASARHGAVGTHTGKPRIMGYAAVVAVGIIEEWQGAYLEIVGIAHTVNQHECARPVLMGYFERPRKIFFPLLGCAASEFAGHALRDGIETGHKGVGEEALAAEVDSHGVFPHVGGKHRAVARQDVATLGSYGVDFRQFLEGEVVPFVGRDNGRIPQLVDYAAYKE